MKKVARKTPKNIARRFVKLKPGEMPLTGDVKGLSKYWGQKAVDRAVSKRVRNSARAVAEAVRDRDTWENEGGPNEE